MLPRPRNADRNSCCLGWHKDQSVVACFFNEKFGAQAKRMPPTIDHWSYKFSDIALSKWSVAGGFVLAGSKYKV